MSRLVLLLFLFWANVCQAQWQISQQIQEADEQQIPKSHDLVIINDLIIWETLELNNFLLHPQNLTLRVLDENLLTKQETAHKLADNQAIEARHLNAEAFYWLLREPDKQVFDLLKIDAHTGEKNLMEGKFLTRMPITMFKTVGNKAVFVGKYNDRPVVELFSFIERTAKVLPDVYANHLEIVDIATNENNKTIFVVLNDKKHCSALLKIYDYEGKLLNVINLPERISLISAQLASFSETENLLVGNYTQICNQQSQGVYALKIENNALKKANFKDFGSLEHFFDFLPEKRQTKAKERIENRRQQNKIPTFHHFLIPQKLIQEPEKVIFVADVFFPDAQTNSASFLLTPTTQELARPANDFYNDRAKWGRTWAVIGGQYYAHFNYSHNLVCAFSKDADLLWDNSTTMEELNSDIYSPKTVLTKHEDNYTLSHFKEGNFFSKELVNNQTLSLEPTVSPTEGVSSKTWDEDEPFLYALRDGTILAWGLHPEAKKQYRDVFYIWKMTQKK